MALCRQKSLGISPVVGEKQILQRHSSVVGRQQADPSWATKWLCLFLINMTQCDSNGMKLFFMQLVSRNKRRLFKPLLRYYGHSTKDGEQIRGQNSRTTSSANKYQVLSPSGRRLMTTSETARRIYELFPEQTERGCAAKEVWNPIYLDKNLLSNGRRTYALWAEHQKGHGRNDQRPWLE